MLLFEPGDIDKLSEQLELIITDDALRERLSEESKKLALEKFNLNTVTEEVAEIYEKILAR